MALGCEMPLMQLFNLWLCGSVRQKGDIWGIVWIIGIIVVIYLMYRMFVEWIFGIM